jgi:hypothetical protein
MFAKIPDRNAVRPRRPPNIYDHASGLGLTGEIE